eukprot:TRINITY_DN122445_c0_g1_i1.p1 TRINITY_DN122445_c0_g1~~TRINITY_DN122445_c0_g1_i1.p1  ORF type:complete len:351 (+),score=75.74 TRINITY_DN122445_c0_g1_i1:88-1140(+)
MARARTQMSLSDIKAKWEGVDIALQDAVQTMTEAQQRVKHFLKDLETAEEHLKNERECVERAREEVKREAVALEMEREKLAEEKARMLKAGIGTSDLVGLNFGGQAVITVKRSLLLQCEDSFLAAMFSGRHEDSLDRDALGNVFLDYSPTVMLPLIEYLRLQRDAAPEDTVPLPDIPECSRKAWDSMLRVFLLSDFLHPTFVFSGIRQDVKISDLNGWTMFFCEPYSHFTEITDFTSLGDKPGAALLVGARRTGAETLAVAAMGQASIITAEHESTKTTFHNGAYWYCKSGGSFGFAPSEDLFFSGKVDGRRLNWHLTGKHGGYRAGAECTLNWCADWEKVIFVSKADLP